MTKNVRIENADTNPDVGLVVETWDAEADGTETLTREDRLSYPTQMFAGVVTSTRRFVIREVKSDA
jgi:hypothetical protein